MRIGCNHVNSVNEKTGRVRKVVPKKQVLARQRQVEAILAAAEASRDRTLGDSRWASFRRRRQAADARAARVATRDARPAVDAAAVSAAPRQPPLIPPPEGWERSTTPWVPREVAAALKGLKGLANSPETPWHPTQGAQGRRLVVGTEVGTGVVGDHAVLKKHRWALARARVATRRARSRARDKLFRDGGAGDEGRGLSNLDRSQCLSVCCSGKYGCENQRVCGGDGTAASGITW